MNHMRATLLLAAVLSAGLFPAAVPAADKDTIRVTVDTAKPGAKIDRNIFGQFAEHLGSGIYGGIWVGRDSTIPNTRGIRNDVVAALKALKVPDVRWPGGCFADQYNWRRGVGPERKPAVGEPIVSAPTNSMTSPRRSEPTPTSRSISAPAPRRKPPNGSST